MVNEYKIISWRLHGSIDLVLTDPPYGITSCKWNSVIPFEPMWKQLKRIVKRGGAIVLFGSEPFSSLLRVSNIKWYKYDWIWEKEQSSSGLQAKIAPLKKHENISVFYQTFTDFYNTTKKNQSERLKYKKDNFNTYNPQMTVGKPYKGHFAPDAKVHGKATHYVKDNDGTRYPTSILRFNKEKGLHPTQKPVYLLEYLVRTYTNEGETVLDFTMGSGSTGVACVNTGRNFIGIELDPTYFDIAKKRIEEAEKKFKGGINGQIET